MPARYFGCELISNCIFTWGFTRGNNYTGSYSELWIDFKLYFYVRIHKFHNLYQLTNSVVNWFQIVFLREDSQEEHFVFFQIQRCELISNCIFTWGFTSMTAFSSPIIRLWIDFKLYFYVRIHKKKKLLPLCFRVVNWFQIVFLREDSQDQTLCKVKCHSCELISNCIFTWGFTRSLISVDVFYQLWIDFKLYFYVRIHKFRWVVILMQRVVNWFQIVFLREDSQAPHF